MSATASSAADAAPSAARHVPPSQSFNTERDTKGAHPRKTLEEKSLDARRSSFSGPDLVNQGSEKAIQPIVEEPLEEPPAPKPYRRANQFKGMAEAKAPVILTSKPTFSSLQRARRSSGEKPRDSASAGARNEED